MGKRGVQQACSNSKEVFFLIILIPEAMREYKCCHLSSTIELRRNVLEIIMTVYMETTKRQRLQKKIVFIALGGSIAFLCVQALERK